MRKVAIWSFFSYMSWEDRSGKDKKWFEIGSFQGTGIKSFKFIFQTAGKKFHVAEIDLDPPSAAVCTTASDRLSLHTPHPHQTPRSSTFLFWLSHVENILHK